MQKFDFDKLEKNSCGNHNFLWLFAVVAVFLTDVTILAGSHLCMRIQKMAFTDQISYSCKEFGFQLNISSSFSFFDLDRRPMTNDVHNF